MCRMEHRILLRAPAKLNLSLCIGRRRPDGFHDLESLFQAVGLYDELRIEAAPAAAGITLRATDPTLPCDARNTVYRAAVALREAHAPGRGARLHLTKRIPSEAGLGGGSSDAAAALIGLNRLWQLGLPVEALLPLAAAVGSDVPFFLHGGCALVRGRGEIVSPLSWVAPGWLVIARPAFGVSTARAYADLAAGRGDAPHPDCAAVTEPLLEALSRSDTAAAARTLRNDLEAPVTARHPEIEALRQALLAVGALAARMSGSGSAVFGLFSGEDAARTGAARLAGSWPWVVAVPPVASGVEEVA